MPAEHSAVHRTAHGASQPPSGVDADLGPTRSALGRVKRIGPSRLHPTALAGSGGVGLDLLIIGRPSIEPVSVLIAEACRHHSARLAVWRRFTGVSLAFFR